MLVSHSDAIPSAHEMWQPSVFRFAALHVCHLSPQADKVEMCPACGVEGLSTSHLFFCTKVREDIDVESRATSAQLFSKCTADIVTATKYVVAARFDRSPMRVASNPGSQRSTLVR